MKRTLLRRLAGKRDLQGDEGIALILVVSVSFIVTLLITTLMSYTVISVKNARHEQDYQAALSAAQAGVDDYLARLNGNNVYWQTTDCTNPAMKRPMSGSSPTCGWGAGTPVGWVPIAGAQAPVGTACSLIPTPVACATYHYDVDTTSTLSSGTISVTATGKSKAVTRSIRVNVRRQGFGDFLYFTDYETVDPANPFVFPVNSSDATSAATQCARHFWDSPSRTSAVAPSNDSSLCRDITFVGGDVINGPLHSNDAILITSSATFNGPVTTAYPSCATVPYSVSNCYRNGGGSAPLFNKGISYVSRLPMPASNGALLAQTVAGTAVGTPGCGYTGPTRIHFNSDGTMDVWSPYTKTVNSGCGTAPFTSASQHVTVPNNNVIFVVPVPSGQATPPSGNCVPGAIGGYPQANDDNANYGEYDCRAGTVFVDGVLSGRVTIGAGASIIIVDDITYAGGTGGGDSLGLVASNSVAVYHPVACTVYQKDSRGRFVLDSNGDKICTTWANMNRPDGTTFQNPIIQAAILSLQHSFAVQEYSRGAQLGSLNVFGSIGQLYRGAVGTSAGTGYLKSYVYDTRLRFAPPPFYLNPVQAKYVSAVFAEVHPAY